MVRYSGLRFWKDAGTRDRAIDRLLALRAGLMKTVTPNNKQTPFTSQPGISGISAAAG